MKKRQIFTDTEYAMRKWKMKREELSDALAPYISPVVWKTPQGAKVSGKE